MHLNNLDSRLRACEEISWKTGTIQNRSMYKSESDREPCSISSQALARERAEGVARFEQNIVLHGQDSGRAVL